MVRPVPLLLAAAILALILAACGGGAGDSPDSSPVATPSPAPTATAASQPSLDPTLSPGPTLTPVEPPPDLIESGEDWRTWVEVPAPIIRANLIPNEPEPLLRIAYDQSTIENCARPGNQELKLDGYDIIAEVTLMQPPSTAWAIPCGEEVVELDTVLAIGDAAALEPGETYRVIVNERETTTFTVPETHLEYTFIAESPIESVEVMSIDGDGESGQAQYQLRVVSGMPRGSGCSQYTTGINSLSANSDSSMTGAKARSRPRESMRRFQPMG